MTFPVVDGDSEVLEIKCGRNAKVIGKQKITHYNLIAEGIPLRVVEVRIASFDSNQFLIEERRFQNLV